jgi:hypothetical protein
MVNTFLLFFCVEMIKDMNVSSGFNTFKMQFQQIKIEEENASLHISVVMNNRSIL